MSKARNKAKMVEQSSGGGGAVDCGGEAVDRGGRAGGFEEK
ncbi:hypothetical protein Tco_0995525, partial [Tanacetum coccineum]